MQQQGERCRAVGSAEALHMPAQSGGIDKVARLAVRPVTPFDRPVETVCSIGHRVCPADDPLPDDGEDCTARTACPTAFDKVDDPAYGSGR